MELKEKAEIFRKNIDKNIFKGYDIRGNATITKESPEITLNDESAYLVGQAIASLYKGKERKSNILITSDHRPSSDSLKKALCQGCSEGNANVFFVEEATPTGVTSWAILKERSKFDVSVQITGSHNPYYNNGFKITCKQNEKDEPDLNGIPKALYGEQLQELYTNIINNSVEKNGNGKIEKISDLVPSYQESMLNYFKNKLDNGKFKNNFRVLLDAGNGLGCKSLEILKNLDIEIKELFIDLDGIFPNHPADPSKYEGIKAAQDEVKILNKNEDKNLWIGFVFDGDGDRAGIIDEAGQGIYPEKLILVNYTRFVIENQDAIKLLSSMKQTISLALDVRGTAVIGNVIESYGRLLSLYSHISDKKREEAYINSLNYLWKKPEEVFINFAKNFYNVNNNISSLEINDSYNKLLIAKYNAIRKHNKEEKTTSEIFEKSLEKLFSNPKESLELFKNHFSLEDDIFKFENFEEWEEIQKESGFGIIGKYIACGYPYHRTHVRKEINQIDKILQNKTLSEENKKQLNNIKLTYTSAESSGHFFYATCKDMPEVMVDDGIFYVLQVLYMLDTIDEYEAKFNLLDKKAKYKFSDIFNTIFWLPCTNEIRGNAPESQAKKFEIVKNILNTIREEKQNPSGKFSKNISHLIEPDGIRVEFEDKSFFLVRASNTSAKFTYKFEAQNYNRLCEVISESISIIENYESQGVTVKELKQQCVR